MKVQCDMAARSVVIFIAIWNIFQGLIYGMLSIIAIFTYNCKISTDSSKASYLLYLVYFRDQRCGSYQWKVISDVPHEPNWPSVTNVAFRTHILFSIYLVLSILLIATSFWIILGCFLTCMGRATYYCFFLPWLVICGATIVFDVAALANFLYDLFNTLETEMFLKHLQIEKTPSVHQAFKGNESYLWLPSVVMLLIAGRCFIFWCMNVVFFNCVAINGRAISKSADKSHRAHSQANSHFNGSTFSENRFDRSFSPSSGMTGSMKRMPYPSYPADPPKNSRPWSPLSHSTSFEYSHNRPSTLPKNDAARHVSPVKLISTTCSPANLLIADLTNPWREVDTVDGAPQQRHSHRPQQFEMLEKPSKLKMLSDAVYKFDDSESRSTFYPARDLAGRVPWSIKRNEISKQKVKFEDFDSDETPVVVPGYKLHFATTDEHEQRRWQQQQQHQHQQQQQRANGVTDRNGSSNHRMSDTSDGHWTGPEYRY